MGRRPRPLWVALLLAAAFLLGLQIEFGRILWEGPPHEPSRPQRPIPQAPGWEHHPAFGWHMVA